MRGFESKYTKPVEEAIRNLINDALRQHIARAEEPLEETLRRVLREELRRAD